MRPRPPTTPSVVPPLVLLFAFASTLLAPVLPAHAQDEEDELNLLFSRTEVTTASKAPEPAALAPADVTVITEDEIRRSGARDLTDLLRTVVGIELERDQFGAVQIVSRGLYSPSESNYILLLLDGVPANIPYYGGASLVYDDLALTGVKRVEIVRGPGSALYGASAFAGVIQVFTKTGDDDPGAEAGVGGGSYPAEHAFATLRRKVGKDGSIAVRADALNSDGPKIPIAADAFTGVVGPDGPVSDAPGNAAAGKRKFHLGLTGSMGDTTLYASLLWNKRDDWLGNYVIVEPINHYIEVDGYARLEWNRKFVGDRLALQTAVTAQQHNEYEDQQVFPQARFDQDGNGTVDDFRAERAQDVGNLGSNGFSASTQASWRFAPLHVLLAGIDYQTVNQTDTYFHENWDDNGIVSDRPLPFNTAVSRQVVGGFVNDDWVIAAKLPALYRLRILAGVRYDFYKDNVFLKQTFGDGPAFSALAPRAGLVWEVARGVYAKYLYGHAFRPASFRELYSDDPNVVVGETNLKPEVVDFHEVSAGLLRPQVQVQVTGFLGRARDQIVSRNQGTTILFGNLGVTDTQGVEADVSVTPRTGTKVFANATVQRVRQTDIGVDAPYVSRVKGSVGGWIDATPWLTVYGAASYLGARRQPDAGPADADVPAYTWITATLTFHVSRHVDLQASGQNLADAKIRDPFDGAALPDEIPGEGRSFWGEARFRF